MAKKTETELDIQLDAQDEDDLSLREESATPDESKDMPGEPAPPAPKAVETRVDEMPSAPPLQPDPEPLPAVPPQPVHPTVAELTAEEPLNIHECHLPVQFISEKDTLMNYVNKNEHLLNKPRRKLDTSRPVIKQGYPIFKQARIAAGFHPQTDQWYTAAVILVAMKIPLHDPELANTDEILDGLAPRN